jgi:hypothetical protein
MELSGASGGRKGCTVEPSGLVRLVRPGPDPNAWHPRHLFGHRSHELGPLIPRSCSGGSLSSAARAGDPGADRARPDRTSRPRQASASVPRRALPMESAQTSISYLVDVVATAATEPSERKEPPRRRAPCPAYKPIPPRGVRDRAARGRPGAERPSAAWTQPLRLVLCPRRPAWTCTS